MRHVTTRLVAAAGAGALLVTGIGAGTPGQASSHPDAKHVILVSVDGMHQADLEWYVQHHPGSAFAALVANGVQFNHAQTPFPSDSFPGLIGQVTGGNPSSTGIFYDDSFNHALLPAGTTSCATATPGAEVTYFEQADRNPHALDAGQGITPLPSGILKLTGNAATLLDPKQLPVDPASCQPVYPHSYLRVNTIFEVARNAGLRTAWSDKHPAYEILNGPSGTGVQDLFTPEINSNAPTSSGTIDWTADNAFTQQYDGYKVQAVLNEIDGFDHSRSSRVGTPSIFGMNFQSVSTAEKLPTSNGLTGGYLADGRTPGPLLSRALDFVDRQLGRMVAGLAANGLDKTTVIVLSAKHGQSPQTPSALTRIDDGPIIDALNAAWKAKHPSATQPLVAFAIDDDGMLMWLNDRSGTATGFAKDFLLHHSGVGNDIAGKPRAYSSSGLDTVYAGGAVADLFDAPKGDPRLPDVLGIAHYGTVYTGKMKKIAEHGGANPQDRDVPLIVSGVPIAHHATVTSTVETTQIAPTILRLLDLNPELLQAVAIERTRPLDIS
jgi:hypothetical protein